MPDRCTMPFLLAAFEATLIPAHRSALRVLRLHKVLCLEGNKVLGPIMSI